MKTVSIVGAGMPGLRYCLLLCALLAVPLAAGAEETPASGGESAPDAGQTMPGMDHGTMEGMDHGSMPGMDHGTMEGMDHNSMPGMDHGTMEGMDHGSMPGMDHGTMEGMDHGSMSGMDHGAMPQAPAGTVDDTRDPHAFSDGYDFGPLPRPHLADEHPMGAVFVDQLQAVRSGDRQYSEVALHATYGLDFDQLRVNAEAQVDDGDTGEASGELLWSHAVASFWNVLAGVRHDRADGVDSSWLALGLDGMAPYWFDVSAMAYWGEAGQAAIKLDADYELLLTQRLVLTPRLAADAFARDDATRATGAGLSLLSGGLQLGYEITRQLLPYLALDRSRYFGGSAGYARTAGQPVQATQYSVGVSFWF